jgi:hypothetical protein
MLVQEQYDPYPVAANGTQIINPANPTGSSEIGGFLCTTSGNAKIAKTPTGAGADIVALMPVVAGTFYSIPCTLRESTGSALVLSGGAAGTLFASI